MFSLDFRCKVFKKPIHFFEDLKVKATRSTSGCFIRVRSIKNQKMLEAVKDVDKRVVINLRITHTTAF